MNYSTWLKVKTVARSWPAHVAVAASVASVVVDELAAVLGADHPAVTVAVRVAALLGAVVAVVRKVTPVLPDARGLLPTIGEPVTSNEAFYAREMDHLRSVIKDGG